MPSDFVPFKRRVDVLIVGHAYAPRGVPTRSLFASAIIGTMKKTIVVFGDRTVLPSGEVSKPAEISHIPLSWERAAGGPGTSNPVGVARAPFGSMASGARIPNLQPPGVYAASALDLVAPTGFGPLSPDWPDRTQKLGRSATNWDHYAWYNYPLPSDVDGGYFNSAPADQQLDYIAPDESIALENLHPSQTHLVTRLEGVVPRAVVRRPQQPELSLELRSDTLWIDTDRGVCCVTWRASLPFETIEGGEIHITTQRRRLLPYAADTTVQLDAGIIAAVLRGSDPTGDPSAHTEETIPLGAVTAQRTPLPFVRPPPGATPSVASPSNAREHRASLDDGTTTRIAPLFVSTSALPFDPPSAPTGAASLEPITTLSRAPLSPEPFGVPPPAMVGPIPAALEADQCLESSASIEKPVPPAMLGPIAPAVAPADSPESPASAIDPEAFALETWAEIAAEIDKANRPRSDVLRDHALTDLDFDALDRRWKAALEREAASGGWSLRSKHDAAYVGALERLRGRPLTPHEYAHILSAAERRDVPGALGALEMPAAAHLPIVRQWTTKIARDPKLSFEILQAIAALREGASNQAPATS